MTPGEELAVALTDFLEGCHCQERVKQRCKLLLAARKYGEFMIDIHISAIPRYVPEKDCIHRHTCPTHNSGMDCHRSCHYYDRRK